LRVYQLSAYIYQLENIQRIAIQIPMQSIVNDINLKRVCYYVYYYHIIKDICFIIAFENKFRSFHVDHRTKLIATLCLR